MRSLMQCSSLVVAIDRYFLSVTKMKIGKAPTLLKKAVSMCKSKTGVLTTKLLLLASLRRRMAMATVISHKIQALIVTTDQARGDNRHKAKNIMATSLIFLINWTCSIKKKMVLVACLIGCSTTIVATLRSTRRMSKSRQ
jgi:hypothetical protein